MRSGSDKPLFSWRAAIASEHGPESSTTRHVLITISLHMGERGDSAFPSLSTLATESGLSKSTVVRHVEKAIEDGWLNKMPRKRDSGADSSNVYQPSVPDDYEHDEQKVFSSTVEGVAEVNTGGSRDEHGGLQSETRGVAEEDPNVNSSFNSSDNSPESEPAREEGEPPCTIDQAVAKGQEVMVSEELCREWWHYHNAQGWKKDFSNIGSAVKRWKFNDIKFNGPRKSDEKNKPAQRDAIEAGGHHWGEDGTLRDEHGNEVFNERGYAITK